VYIRNLKDVDMGTLRELMSASYLSMKETYA